MNAMRPYGLLIAFRIPEVMCMQYLMACLWFGGILRLLLPHQMLLQHNPLSARFLTESSSCSYSLLKGCFQTHIQCVISV